MKYPWSSTVIAGLALGAFVGIAAADSMPAPATDKTPAAGFEQHGPHEHGTGKLSIAQDGGKLELDLDSPGMNLFGFEYMPKTDADKKAVADAEAKLKDGATLFVFDEDAGCQQTDVKVTTAQEKPDADEAAHDKGEVHSDVEASWVFTCEKPEALQTVTPKLFSTFSGFHKLNVEWVTDKGASSATLEKDDNIKLAP